MSPFKSSSLSESAASTEENCVTPSYKKPQLSMKILPKPLIEDKENTDPVLDVDLVFDDKQKCKIIFIIITSFVDDCANLKFCLVGNHDVSTSSDGFEVCDDLKLDDTIPESHDDSGSESSPFMKSLICNKLMFSLDKV